MYWRDGYIDIFSILVKYLIIVALVLGLIGVVLSVGHLGSSTGGFGTGGGRAGAIIALVLGLIGMNLGGLALARSRRPRSTG